MVVATARGCSTLTDASVPLTTTRAYDSACLDADECEFVGYVPPAAPEGYAEFVHSGNNYMTVPIDIPVDASVEIRVDCVVPPVPAVSNDYRPYSQPLNILFGNTVVQGAFRNSSAVMRPTGNRTYAQLASAGFPATGERVHLRTIWDAVADTVRWEWKLPTTPLDEFSGWTLPSSVTATYAGEAIDDTWATLVMSSTSAASAFVGRCYRWLVYINGTLQRDVQPSLNVDPGHENDSYFESTTVGPGDPLDHSTDELRDSYAGKGTSPLTTADTGQTWHHSGGFPLSIINNAVGNNAFGAATAGYIDVPFGAEVTRIGAKFRFEAPGSTSTGFATILVWATPFTSPIPDSPCHIGISPVFASYSIWDATVNTVLWTYVFPEELSADGVTEHLVDIVIEGTTASVRLPDGVVVRHTDARIGSLNGDNAGLEVFHLASDTDHRPRFTEVWSDTTPISGDLIVPGRTVTVVRTGSPSVVLASGTGRTTAGCALQAPAASGPADRLGTPCTEDDC
jgi:hypothetical protein